MPSSISAMPLGGGEMMKGGRRGVPVKTLKKILKKAGLKTSGKKATLTRRAKKAHLKMRGGVDDEVMAGGVGEMGEGDGAEGGRRRRRGSRKSRGFRLY